ncbi:MAG: V4R domain-containing protein [Clostridiales bacterium]|uniref:V4R domain-containing protein n=1 Tax=Robinsoniella sp. TaxID=2496533 RepID=UPI0029086588|nr:4-vinyl reductase [Clostridiales bacterium]MDU3240610.1 V4R domain-containing protein [Clostridiales bacterium]
MEKNESRKPLIYSLDVLGDVQTGRRNLGPEMPVIVYRLFMYSMRDTLEQQYGLEKTVQILRDCGKKAGMEFAEKVLDLTLDMDAFLIHLQKILSDFKIGILRIESFDDKERKAVFTISEDVDCSGLPILGMAVCNYDEGFLDGILKKYTGNSYKVTEIDCWAKGDRVCRFEAVEDGN